MSRNPYPHSGTNSLHFSIFLYIPYIISSPAEIQNPSKHRARMTRGDRNLTSGLSEVDVESRTSEESSVPPPIQSSRCFRSSYPGTKKNINPGLGNESPQKGTDRILTSAIGRFTSRTKAYPRLSVTKMCEV